MRKAFIDTLIELAANDDNIYLIVADLGFSVVEPFFKEYPKRAINAGISEQNAIGMAAGLALSGKKVFVYSIIPFITMRCYEQIRIDIAYHRLNITIVGVGSGVTYGLAGTTHHALEDIALMRVLPGMTVCAPSDPISFSLLLKDAINTKTPWYFRVGREILSTYSYDAENYSTPIVNNDGSCLVVAAGTIAAYTNKNLLPELLEYGISPAFQIVNKISPLKTENIRKFIDNGKPVIVVEDHFSRGGLHSHILEELNRMNYETRLVRGVSYGTEYTHQIGNSETLERMMLEKDWNIAKIFLQKHAGI